MDELTEEDKAELRKEISTIKKSIGEERVPKNLEPIINVPIDMLNINYLLFMIQSGYIQPDGQGSEFILESYLYSPHKRLREKSWEALANINSEAAIRAQKNYMAEVERRAVEHEKKYGNMKGKKGSIGEYSKDIGYEIRDGFQSLRNKIGK